MEKTDKYILFHDFKHHLCCSIDVIKQEIPIDAFVLKLKTLGNSQFDLYLGNISPLSIKEEVYNWLSERSLLSEEEYQKWINGNKGYRTIYLSDNSEWTLRYLKQQKYVHIHPSRYSKHTLRIKANILKTVLITIKQNTGNEIFNIEKINTYRQLYLGLPPVKKNGDHTELIKIYNLIMNNLRAKTS